RQLGTLGGEPGACLFLEGERRLAAAPARGGPVRLIDPASARVTSVAVPGGLGRLSGLSGGGALAGVRAPGVSPGGGGRGGMSVATLPAGTHDPVPSPDGRMLYALAADGALWRAALDGRPAERLDPGRVVASVDAFLDGRRLALGTETEVGVYDLGTGRTT